MEGMGAPAVDYHINIATKSFGEDDKVESTTFEVVYKYKDGLYLKSIMAAKWAQKQKLRVVFEGLHPGVVKKEIAVGDNRAAVQGYLQTKSKKIESIEQTKLSEEKRHWLFICKKKHANEEWQTHYTLTTM
eukprot:6710319-Ditylum_brightwellii.AAC.1